MTSLTGFPELPRGRDGEGTVRPGPELASEPRPDEPGNDPDVLLRQSEHLREDVLEVEDALGLLVDGQHRAIPGRDRSLQLDRVVRLGWHDIGLVELDRRARKRLLDVSALALEALGRGEGGGHDVGLVVGHEIGGDVGLLLVVGGAHRVGRGLGALERVRHRERDVLAVVANVVVGERRATLVDDAFEAGPEGRAEDLPDVSAMEHRPHAGHLLGGGGVELRDAAVGDRRFDRHGVQHPGKVKVGGVLGLAGHFQRAVPARRAAADR